MEGKELHLPDTCGGCRYFGFSFSCVEGYCTREGKPMEELATACEDFRPVDSRTIRKEVKT